MPCFQAALADALSRGQSVIVPSELFPLLQTHSRKRLAALLAGFDTHVVLTHRALPDQVGSWFKQQVKDIEQRHITCEGISSEVYANRSSLGVLVQSLDTRSWLRWDAATFTQQTVDVGGLADAWAGTFGADKARRVQGIARPAAPNKLDLPAGACCQLWRLQPVGSRAALVDAARRARRPRRRCRSGRRSQDLQPLPPLSLPPV